MTGQRLFDALILFGCHCEHWEPRRTASEDKGKCDWESAAELDDEKTISEQSQPKIHACPPGGGGGGGGFIECPH